MPEVSLVRLATAQVVVCEDPSDSGQLRRSGRDARELMRHRLDVDAVLFSTVGPSSGQPFGAAAFAAEAQAHAATNSLWVSFAMSAQHSVGAPAGTIAPDGRWVARCPGDGQPALARP